MNDDRLNHDDAVSNDLSRALRQFIPAPLPATLQRQLESAAGLDHRRHATNTPLADRILAFWTCSGALATCTIAALTLGQLAGPPRPAPAAPQDLAMHQQTVQEFEKVIASR